jgi:hypothetical protein
VHAGFLTYEHRGPLVDAVFTRNALHHLPDYFKAIALDRVGTWLRPRGVLRLRDLIFDFQPTEAASAMREWLDGAATDAASGYTREDLVEHVRSEPSTDSWLLEAMLSATGFEVVDRAFRRRVYGSYTCLRSSAASR